MSFDGKFYIITGGAGGIGLATAKYLAKRGARILAIDLQKASFSQSEAEFDRITFETCDVTNRKQIETIIEQAVEKFGIPDGLVTSAGVDRHHDFFSLNDDEFKNILDINVLGSFRFTQICARLWKEHPRQDNSTYAVVLLSSVNAIIATATHTAYATSKGAVAQMTRVMSVELAPYGIRVNAMAPGTIRTALLDALVKESPDALDSVLSRTPLGRVGNPEEIASSIAFLLDDASSYVTGQSLYADGGRTIQNLILKK